MKNRVAVRLGGLMVAVVLLALSACGSVPSPTPDRKSTASAPVDQPSGPTPDQRDAAGGPVELATNVTDAATRIAVDTVVRATAKYGTLSEVTLRHDGTASPKFDVTDVTGTMSEDRTSWTADSGLDPAAAYTLTVTGANTAGEAKSETTTFRTVELSRTKQTFVNVYPKDDAVVGIGMPAVLTFDLPVQDKAAFERQLSVTSTPTQPGSWHWFSSTEVHYRPRAYWKPGTKLTVTANLNGINAGNGIYGQNSSTKSFSIGRSVVTKVDLLAKKARVEIDGKLARTILISAGKKGFTTRSGVKVIMEKLAKTRMASETVGIAENSAEGYDLQVSSAMRITQSGEFLHAAPWNQANFGRVNASHGCTGMSTSDAAWLFARVQVGDPVITTGSNRDTEKGNGWTDWDLSWADYQKGSAL